MTQHSSPSRHHHEADTSLLGSRQVLYTPVRGSHLNVMLKDKSSPGDTVAASLRGTTIYVHWHDGFTRGEATRALKIWWPAATDAEFPDA
jgi:hypothetical protein